MFKRVLDISAILVGSINSLYLVEQILTNESANFVSFSRHLNREPDLPNRWMKCIGNQEVDCIFCNGVLATTVIPDLRCAKSHESSAGN